VALVASVLVVVDVDGVVSPVHGSTAWGDDVLAANLFGPVSVSPALVAHLEAWSKIPEVQCLWLSSWPEETRQSMERFPGHDWAVLQLADTPGRGRGWWKLAALEAWLTSRVAGTLPARAQAAVGTVVWLDDHLHSASRRASCARRLGALGIDLLMVAPRTAVGVTPAETVQVCEWIKPRIAETDRHLLDEPWRSSPVAHVGVSGTDGTALTANR
jgi:hypothetical protein